MNYFRIKFIILLWALTHSFTSFAYDFKVNGLCYNKLSDSTVELTWEAIETSYSGDIAVPSYVNYNGKKYDVVAIGDYAMTTVTSINSSGANVGANSNLTSITIPNSVTSIGKSAFSYCSGLTSITIPSSVTSIGRYAFYGCSGLTSITIPNSVTSIGDGAFSSCSGLTSITIPNSVTSIGISAFSGCSGLTSITVSNGNTKYDSRNNCNAIIEKSTNTLITGCKNTVIPNSVTSIGDYAFYCCSALTSITIPNSVTSIGNSAFAGCSALTSITIPNSVTSIGNSAFAGCSALTSITIPNSVTSIGYIAFSGCSSLKDVISEIQNPFVINENVFSSHTYSTAKLTVPSGTKSAYQSTRGWNKFTNIVEAGGDNSSIISFEDANVKAICVANWDTNGDGELSEAEAAAVKDIGTVFSYNKTITSFKELKYFSGLEIIPSNAFRECTLLKSIIFPETIISIGKAVLYKCSSIESLTIPKSVVSIGDNAFVYCSGLTSIIVESGNTIYDSRNNCNALIQTSSNSLLAGCRNTIIPNSVTSIGDAAFIACSGLSFVTIPNSVTLIDANAFAECSGLTSVTIPNSVKSIGKSAFKKCSGLISVTISNNLTSISNDTFAYCSSLTSVIIPDGVISIGLSSFYECTSLTSVIFHNSLTSIGNAAFYGCSDLTSVILPNSVTSIGNGAFQSCGSLASVKSEIINPYKIDDNVFNRISSEALLYVPNGTKEKYQTYEGWTKNFKEIIESSTGTDSQIISFEDANVKAICVANWDTNGDGELSEQEAAEVTDIGIVFRNIKTISSFDEFKYFTGIQEIPSVAFESCTGLTSITIPNSVTRIGKTAFYGCSDLVSILIPNSVANIGNSAFRKCSGLTSIIVSSENAIFDSRDNCNAIIETNSNTLIAGCKNTIIPNSVTSIGNGAFYGCSSLTSITIPNCVTNIGNGAFYECLGLTSLTIPNSVTYIDNSAFLHCSDLTSIVVESGNTKYDSRNNCNAIIHTSSNSLMVGCMNTTIPNSVTNISYSAFENCNGLTSITIPISVISISGSAFKNCSNLKDVKSEIINPYYLENSVFDQISSEALLYIPARSKEKYQNYYGWTNPFKEIIESTMGSITYTLTIKTTGYGSAMYNGATIRRATSIFAVNEGSSATITFTPDNDYCIKSVKLNNSDITSNVNNNTYTINSISANTSFEIEFEGSYTLTVDALGSGSASYNGTSVRNSISYFIVNPDMDATIKFFPDNGYVIKSVRVNDSNVTWWASNKQYTINNISTNTTLKVYFERDASVAYNVYIKATGNGNVIFNGDYIRNKYTSHAVGPGTDATIEFCPDDGYRIKSVWLEKGTSNVDITSRIINNKLTIGNISNSLSLEVEFEAIPSTTYTLSIKASGNGSVSYEGAIIRNYTNTFTVKKGANATMTFTPDNGNHLNTVLMNGTDVSSQVSGNQYTISNITANTTMDVTFAEELNAFTANGVSYKVVSQSDKTVNVDAGNYGQVLTVPASVTANGYTWTVVGIETDALSGNKELAAVIWNPYATFNAKVSNPNLLLYVKAEQYAPSSIQNVVVNGNAKRIVLKEAQSGNNFYCPQAFTAQQISYTHNYQMQTGIGESKGWETIALPFDVQTITHATKGEIKPFANWKSGDAAKPFWLYELTGTGFVETESLKAYTPYIISMPNNSQYSSQWLLNGKVTFAATGVTIGKTENLNYSVFNGRTFTPCFTDMDSDMAVYSLNVDNDYETNNSGMTEGSMFVWKLRHIHPFEAYMTNPSSAPEYAFGVFDGMTTSIENFEHSTLNIEHYYDLQGRRIEMPTKKGVYIVNGKKKIIK